jgi:peptidyl-prolyl cis-trans isomerase B (cyclophilin B)
MNRGDDYNSATSSFFILTEDKPELDGIFASFGEVVSGYEIVDKIAGDMIENPDEQAPTILLVSITEKR